MKSFKSLHHVMRITNADTHARTVKYHGGHTSYDTFRVEQLGARAAPSMQDSWCGRAADRMSAQAIYLRVVVTVLAGAGRVGVASAIATPLGTLAR